MMKPIVIFIIEWVLFVAVNALLVSYLVIFFKKKKFNTKYFSKKLIILNLALLELTLIPLIIGTVGAALKWGNTANTVLLVIGFVELLSVCGMLFFLLQYIAIGFTDTHIEFLGEKIQLSKVYDLEINSKKNKYYIHYYEGKRGQKKYGFNIKSQAYFFIKENEETVQNKMIIENTENSEVNNDTNNKK